MLTDWQLTRQGLFWMLMTFVVSTALHIAHLPVWVTLLAIAAAVWRILHYQGRLPFPGKAVKVLFVLLISAGLVLQYTSPLGLEPMLALFSAGYSLKLLEMHNRRDALLIIYLGYFISAAACLFDQMIPTFLAVLGCFALATASLNAISQSRSRPFSFQPIKLSAVLLLVSVPLMLVLFMIMPRLGSIWSVPGPTGQAKTGIGSTVSPGDFTKLSRSAEVAFRVEFEEDVPSPDQLYWRGLVLSEFDGRSWSQSYYFGNQSPILTEKQIAEKVTRKGQPLNYQIVMEPTYNRWFFSLPYASSNHSSLVTVNDFRQVSLNDIQFRSSYQVSSWLDYSLEPVALEQFRKELALRLPAGFNPETRAIARQWAAESNDPHRLIERVLKLFNQSFTYTLEPPALGTHSVDEFLWDTQKGFCEHFASSFVFFMRAAGIPARVVAGYQGGEVHPTQGFVTVRQYDAHAWAEVWVKGEGWIRVDPTAAVAPERIEMGFDATFEESEFLSDSPLSLVRFRNIGLVNWLRLKLDSLDYIWATWVLGYEQKQYELLAKLLGKVDPVRIALFLLVGTALTLLPVLLLSLRPRFKEKLNPADRYYLKFCKKAAVAGVARKPGEGPRDYAIRLCHRWPEQTNKIKQITDCYIKQQYAEEFARSTELKHMCADFRFI